MTKQFVDPREVECIQSRIGTRQELIQEYLEMMQSGIIFDAVKAIRLDNGNLIVWDGKHRTEAAKLFGQGLWVEFEDGTRQDAAWKSFAANKTHGLRRNREDIVKAVHDALQHPFARGKSDREIASWVGCDHKTVGKYRKCAEVLPSGEIPTPEIPADLHELKNAILREILGYPVAATLKTIISNETTLEIIAKKLPAFTPEAIRECAAAILKQIGTPIHKSIADNLYTIGNWQVKIPDDIEISDNAEIWAHSPHGERFLQNINGEERAQLVYDFWRRTAPGIAHSLEHPRAEKRADIDDPPADYAADGYTQDDLEILLKRDFLPVDNHEAVERLTEIMHNSERGKLLKANLDCVLQNGGVGKPWREPILYAAIRSVRSHLLKRIEMGYVASRPQRECIECHAMHDTLSKNDLCMACLDRSVMAFSGIPMVATIWGVIDRRLAIQDAQGMKREIYEAVRFGEK